MNEHLPMKEFLKLFFSFFWDKDFLYGAAYVVGFFVIIYIVGIFL